MAISYGWNLQVGLRGHESTILGSTRILFSNKIVHLVSQFALQFVFAPINASRPQVFNRNIRDFIYSDIGILLHLNSTVSAFAQSQLNSIMLVFLPRISAESQES